MELSDYFALQPPEKLGQALFRKVTDAGAKTSITARFYGLLSRAFAYYFGKDAYGLGSAHQITRGGDTGELAMVRVNHARSLVGTLQNLILSNRIVWQPKSTNDDFESYSQTILASSLLDYYWRDQQIERYAARALEEAICFGEGFLYIPWDPTKGEDVVPEFNAATGAVSGTKKTGDFDFQNVSSWNVIRDPYKTSFDQSDWLIIHTRKNRYNLAAEYPDKAEEILRAPVDLATSYEGQSFPGRLADMNDTDDISVWHFYHKRTPAVPSGRETCFITDKCILYDRKLTYEDIPLYRVYAGEIFGTPFAYTQFFEILGLQELVDSLNTCIATNQTTFGTQMVAAPDGTVVSPESFGGMKLLKYPQGSGNKPEALQLTKSPPEVFSYLKDLVGAMEQLMGLNSVARGEPQSGEQSGAALALLEAKAKQQSSVLEGAYLRFVQSTGMGLLDTLRRKCPYPRRVAITGVDTRALERLETYTGASFDQISRVLVDIGNPLSQTPAGRKELVDIYVQLLGPRMTTEQVEQVMTTGRIEPLTRNLQSQLLLIKSESERLVRGEPVQAMADDDHVLHMREHAGEMSNPELRYGNPQALQGYMQHQQEHWNLYTTMDPARLMALGQQPPPVMGPPPGAPPGPPPGPPEPPAVGLNAPQMPSTPDLPSLPANTRPGLAASPGLTKPS